MKHSSISLLILGLCLLWAAPLYAGSDEYLGDASIYTGVPTELTRPNVLLIIDNSRATLHTAAGYAYDPNTEYPRGESCEEGKDDPKNGCYLPWSVYEQDNQGDFAQMTFSNSSSDLTTLKCDPTNGDKEILFFFQNYGTYSGSGMDPFPNLKSDGGCEYKSFGRVYALGNYLNYVRNAQGDDRVGQLPGETTVDCRGDIVSYCSEFLPNGNCKNNATGYYECIKDHTNVNPVTGDTNDENYPWLYLGTSAPAGTNPTVWSAATSYKAGDCNSSEDDSDENNQITGATQRQIIYEALEQVINDTKKYVNFGAMSYGQNHGGKLINHMSDLSSSDTLLNEFLSKIPGGSNGEGVLNSNTLRPQAESLFDAGWYYGANYTPININQDGPLKGQRIPENIKNVCDLNHIILLTNGFTLQDNFPGLGSGAPEKVIGDADGDKYPDEYVYGQGSHWLDDVAKHLRVKYGIKTHTVLAFQAIDDLVMNAAKDGDGQFYNVYNKDELAEALRKLLISIINESSTSFVAPVVPSSTTNRTISSNNVYLGLFRPQGEGNAWHGNIKKYKLSPTTLQLLGMDGATATDIYGNFDKDSISYWSLAANNKVPTSTTEDGYIDPASTDPNKPHGDGGEVSAGGTGGVLLEKMRGLVADIRADGSSWLYPNWRNIYTYLGATKDLNDSSNLFRPGNVNITVETLDLHDKTGTPLPEDDKEKDNLIRYVHGFADEGALPMTPATAEIRSWVLGDILHSKPVVFNYSKYVPSAENQCYAFDGQGDLNSNSSVIFAGANDGMLHAFRDCDGEELWSFIPPNVLPTLQYYKKPQSASGHAAFVDSAPSMLVHDQNNNGTIEPSDGDKVVLIFGQRRGGGTNFLDETSSRGAYYALDVTNPLDPQFLWEVESNNLGEVGETWSQPRLAKVPASGTSFKIVAFVGTGYDNNEDLRFGETQTFPDSSGFDINTASAGGEVDGSDDPQTSNGTLSADNRHAPRGRGIMAIEVATLTKANSTSPYTITLPSSGTVYWSYTFEDNNQLKYSFPGDLAVLDLNGDSYADTIYTGDTGGNLWKFDVGGADKTQWSGQLLFQSNAGADNSNGRKIFYRPEVAYIGAPHIYFGTGDREHPLNRAVVDRMYCVIDWGDQGEYPVTEATLVDATDNKLQNPTTSKEEADALLSIMLSAPWAPYQESGVSKFTYGWYVKLDGTDRTGNANVLDRGEKVLAPATVFNGEVFFSTYQLQTGARADCEPGNMGISRLYHLNYRTAEAVMNYNLANDDLLSGGENDGETPAFNDRGIGENGEVFDRTDRTRTLGEGIPSGIVTLIDASGNVTQLISSSDKVEAMAAPDIKLISPVYWMQW